MDGPGARDVLINPLPFHMLCRAVKFPTCHDLLMPVIVPLLLCGFSEQNDSQIKLRHFL